VPVVAHRCAQTQMARSRARVSLGIQAMATLAATTMSAHSTRTAVLLALQRAQIRLVRFCVRVTLATLAMVSPAQTMTNVHSAQTVAPPVVCRFAPTRPAHSHVHVS
jgi:hypothetical protein